jgi:enoyl-CoA hydratase
MKDAVIIEADGPVRVVTFNGPDALNAFDDELHLAAFRARKG